MFKKSFSWLLVLLLIFSLLAGCGTNSNTASDNSKSTQNDSTTGTSSDANKSDASQAAGTQTSYPFTIKDDTGTEVTLQAEPKRIISLVPAYTESLFALGLDGKVIAVTKWDNYPQDVQKKVEYSFDDGLNPNTEQILKLNPDLVLLGENSDKVITAIRNLNIPVVVFKPENIASTYQTIQNLGLITNTQAKAAEIVSAMKEKEGLIEDKVATIKPAERLRVWTEVDATLFTAGSGTFIDELVTKAGGINIANDVTGWAQYSAEKVLAKNPQVIFDTYGYYDPNAAANILKRAGWQNLDAVKNKRVMDLDSDMVTRPGPRLIDGMETIAKALYPDLFQ